MVGEITSNYVPLGLDGGGSGLGWGEGGKVDKNIECAPETKDHRIQNSV